MSETRRLKYWIPMILVSFFSCKKKDSSIPIVLTSPKEGDIYHFGDTVRFKGTITRNPQFKFVLQLLYDNSLDILYNKNYLSSDKSFTIDEYWVDTIHGDKAMVLKASVFDNNREETNKTEITIHVSNK